MRLIILSCLAAIIALISFRSIQTFTVHGKITDDQSNTLTGVTVTEKGTSNSVITDSKGEFVITVQSEKSKLVFNYVGFETKEVGIKSRTNLTVSLASSTAKLEEVVVIGYDTDSQSEYERSNLFYQQRGKKESNAFSPAHALPGSAPGFYQFDMKSV